MTPFEQYCERQRSRYGAMFTPPKGDGLIEAYNEAPRLRVKVRTTFPNGSTVERWGFVSLTTGWIPSFMLMRQIGQYGSSDLLDERDEIIQRRYEQQ